MSAMQQALFACFGGNGGAPETPAQVGQALTHAGNGATQSITGASFSPDLVICKRRAGGGGWRWFDSVRGPGLALSSSSSAAEVSEPNGVTSFDANGFSLGNDADTNASGANYLSLVLQETAGAFDVVTYTGTGVNRTVNHNLGVAAEFIVVFDRTGGGNQAVYAAPIASAETKVLILRTTAAAASCSTCWNNTAPSSTQFTVGTASSMNTNGNNYVAYLFASLPGATKIGSYTGDGNTNGPFITTGFKPKWVLIKRTDAAGNWLLFDNQRDATSPHNTFSLLGFNDNELISTNTSGGLAMDDTGFQSIDSGNTGCPVNCAINISGAIYVYLAVC